MFCKFLLELIFHKLKVDKEGCYPSLLRMLASFLEVTIEIEVNIN